MIAGAPLAAGWTGKLWAMSQGVERAAGERAELSAGSPTPTSPTRPDNLRRLVAARRGRRLALASLMARLH